MTSLFPQEEIPRRTPLKTVPMIASDEICLKEAAFRLGVDPKTARGFVKKHRICRQLQPRSPLQISAPALEMLKYNDPAALELFRSGVRNHPDLLCYFTRAGVPV